MTEKQYGGASRHGFKAKAAKEVNKIQDKNINTSMSIDSNNSSNSLSKEEIEKLKQAGKIAKQVVEYARKIIKPEMPLLEIADKIEAKIIELGAKPAFPVTLSINEIAAHATPAFNGTELAKDLLKVDIGVHIDGHIADTAITLDLANSDLNKKLIEAAEKALKEAINIVSLGSKINEIGATIEKVITSLGFEPIRNLSGHKIEKHNVHAGVTIPNFDNEQNKQIEEGVYAIEPFSTNGLGAVKDGKPSGIYHLENPGNVRDNFAREVLEFITEEYKTLPFCSRWIHKKFGTRGLLALRQIESAGLLHHYAQLIESGKGKVAQAEHTIILTEKEKIITTV